MVTRANREKKINNWLFCNSVKNSLLQASAVSGSASAEEGYTDTNAVSKTTRIPSLLRKENSVVDIERQIDK